eukprot:354922-Chlamydomonas_euryale.AAC.14
MHHAPCALRHEPCATSHAPRATSRTPCAVHRELHAMSHAQCGPPPPTHTQPAATCPTSCHACHATSQVEKPSDIAAADRLIFPGVGAFGQAMQVLKKRGYTQALKDYIQVRNGR